MVSANCDAAQRGLTVERAAIKCEVRRVLPIARAIFELAGDAAVRRSGREPAIVASVGVATRRGGRRELDLETAARSVGVNLAAVRRAAETIERELPSPVPDEDVRALRRTIIAVTELLASVESGRTNPPRFPHSTIADADPGLVRLVTGPLEDVDEDALRRHLSRLETDLEMARLGVELHALVEGRR